MKKGFSGKKLLSGVLALLMTATNAVTAVNALDGGSAIARYTAFQKGTVSRSWDVADNVIQHNNDAYASDFYNVRLVDDSSKYPSEAHLAMSDFSSGILNVLFDFKTDVAMNDTILGFYDNTDMVFGLKTVDGYIYLCGSGTESTRLCAFAPNTTYIVKADLDMDNDKVKSVQVNGVTYATDAALVKNGATINSFLIKTTEEATGVVLNENFYADANYIVREEFSGSRSAVGDDWTVSEGCSVHKKNNLWNDKYDLSINASSAQATAEKSFDAVSGKIAFDISFLQPDKGGSFEVALYGSDNKAVAVTSDGSYLYSGSAKNTTDQIAKFPENVYSHIRVVANTGSKTADIYFNERLVKSAVPFEAQVEQLDKIKVIAEAGCKPLYVDDIFVSFVQDYPSDYPVIENVPAKTSGAPLVSMQVCPMWTQGQHYGWDFIKNSSDYRQPILGYYDETSTEMMDWTIKYMKEHGVDFMNICVYPNDPEDSTQVVTPATNTSTRNSGFINAYLNSRYCDQMNFAIFFEANGLASYGNEYYDDFFESVLPQYIEMYFSHPQYQKIDGRPVFGIYSISQFADMLDTGRWQDGILKTIRIQNGIKKIRSMCKEAGVGDPYIVAHQSYKYISDAADYGFDAVTAYGYSVDSNYTVQKKTMEDAIAKCKSEGIDFLASVEPMCDNAAWRTKAGFMHTGEQTEEIIAWVNNTLTSGYTPSKGKTKVINFATWDEYGEGHIMAPTVGNGFAYLDAIRSTTTDGGSHTDAIPTEEQKARFTRMYNQDRKVKDVYFTTEDDVPLNHQVYNLRTENTGVREIPGAVKKTWNLKLGHDENAVELKSGISKLTKTESGIVVTPDSGVLSTDLWVNPKITITDTEGIDLSDVSYIKLRVKRNSAAYGGFVSWTSNFYDEISMGRNVYFNYGNTSDVEDIYVPMYRSPAWAGTLKTLEISLGFTTSNEPYTVESVSLLQDLSVAQKPKVVTNNQTAVLEDNFRVIDSTVMVPINQVAKIVGIDKFNVYNSTNSYLLQYGGLKAMFTLGENTADVNGQTVELEQPAFKVSDAVNDTVYIPLSLFKTIFYDNAIEYYSNSNSLYALKNVPQKSKEIYTINGDSFSRKVSLAVEKNSDGKIIAQATTKDPQLAYGGLSVSAEDVNIIEIRMFSDTNTKFEMFFRKDTDTEWNNAKRVSGSVQKGYNILTIETKDIETWSDTITDIRFDPVTDASILLCVDSFSLMSDVSDEVKLPEVEVEPEPEPEPDPDYNFKPIHTLSVERNVSVFGKTDTEFAGKTVSVLLLDKDADIKNITAGDVLYLNECKVGSDGRYSIEFMCPSTLDLDNCKVFAKVGKREVTKSIITAVSKVSDVIDYSVALDVSGNIATLIANPEDVYGFDAPHCEYNMIFAGYDSSDRALQVVIGEKNERTMEIPLADGVTNVKAFLLRNVIQFIPLCENADMEVTNE